MPKLTQEEVFTYLVKLRDSGVTNMFGATPYLQREFSIPQAAATNWLGRWMDSFKEKE